MQQTQTLNQQRIAAQQPDISMAEAITLVDAKRPATPRQQRYRNWAIAEEVEASEAESGRAHLVAQLLGRRRTRIA